MHRVRVGRQGRLVVPAELRQELGIGPEDILVAWIEDSRLIFRRREDIEQELWEMFADVEGSLSEEIIAEHRREAAREP